MTVAGGGPGRRTAVSPAEVRGELERILASETFSRSERMRRFLSCTVSLTLDGRGDELKEYTIGLAAFDKPDDFDPRIDPIVRVEAGRLRTKLKDYYETEGCQDKVEICFRKRSYAPVFSFRQPQESRAAEDPLKRPAAPLLIESSEPVTERRLDSIAVLPFADLTPKQDQEYFCDGITEELINVLSRIDGLNVTARTTMMQFKHRVADVRAIGQQIGVDAVLEGSVRKDGRRVRISAQLISVADGYNLWADMHDREMSGIFEVQQSIAQSIAQALKFQLEEQAFQGKQTRDFQAYKLYLQGRHHWQKRDPEGLRRAVRYFEKALARDEKYVLACAGLADAYASLVWTGTLAPEAGWERVRQFADRALSLDVTQAPALGAIGALRAAFEWDWSGAEETFRRAIELDPGSAHARHWNALFCLAPQGRIEEAETELQHARDLDPVSPAVHTHLGWLQYCRGNTSAALELFAKALELDQQHYLAHCLCGFAYLAAGNATDALAAFSKALDMQGKDSTAIGGAGRCHAALGNRKQANACLQKLKRRNTYVAETDVAQIYIGAGDLDSVFDWLERAADRRCARLIGLRVDPAYESLRELARFAKLLDRIGLSG